PSAMWCRSCMSTWWRGAKMILHGRARCGARCRRVLMRRRTSKPSSPACARRSASREAPLTASSCAEFPAMRFSPRLPETRMPSRPDLGPKPHLGYTASLIDRAAHRRGEVAALAADQRAGAYVIGGEMIVMRKGASGGEPLFALADAQALAAATGRESVLLGFRDGVPQFGLSIGKEAAEGLKTHDEFLVTDLRSIAVQGLVAPEHLPPLAEAKALLAWHARHRFCSNCGALTDVAEAGWKRICPACRTEHFPRTDPVVIMLAVRGEQCLLGRSARPRSEEHTS